MSWVHWLMVLAVSAFAGMGLDRLCDWLPRKIREEERMWIESVRSDEDAGQAIAPVPPWVHNRSLFPVLSCVVGGLLFNKFGLSLQAFGFWGFGMVLLSLAIIDWRTFLLPDRITLGLLWVGLLIQTMPSVRFVTLDSSVWGAALGYGFFWAIATIYSWLRKRDGLGHGDMKLLAAVGAWLGAFSLPIIMALAGGLALVWHLGVLFFSRGEQRPNALAFGPWIALSALGYVLIWA